MIENPEQRNVHFMFKAPFPKNESEFSIRLRLLLNKKLDEYMEYQTEVIEEYLRKIRDDEVDDLGPCPIREIPLEGVELDLSQFRQLSLACSDDPFFEKSTNEHKFSPSVVFVNDAGERVGECSETEKYAAAEFIGNCRDNKLKMNDDRKVVLRISALNDIQMVLLFVRAKRGAKDGDYS